MGTPAKRLFATFEDVQGMRECEKKFRPKALQQVEAFEVQSIEGLVQGKAGDYLMKGAKGELYVCDREIFETAYEFTEDAVRESEPA